MFRVAGFGSPSSGKIFFQGVQRYIPSSLLTLLLEHSPGSGVTKFRANRREVRKVAEQLLKDKQDNDGGKDVMSLLGRFHIVNITRRSADLFIQ